MRKLGRREFMLGAGGAALAGAATPAKVFAQATPPQGAAPQPQQLVTRRPVGSMQPNDPAMASYTLAVERMRALPDTDPRSWNAITQIHVTSCPHSNWFFLPWHRAYLVAFERICRQVSGDPNFALPYWDWTEQRQIPPAFTAATVAGRANALLDASREAAATDSLREADVGPATIARIMAETDFENFGSSRPTGQTTTEARWLRETGRATELEATPHGGVHVFVGGDMGQMISPRDPIFFLHHCNVDRLWARWIAQGRRNSADPLWATFQFNGTFQVPEGQGMTALNVGVTDMLDHRRWGYTYPDLPAGDGGQVVASAEAAVSRPQRVLASQAAVGTATLNRALSTTLTLPAAQPLVESGASGRAGAAAGNAFDPNAILRETPLGPAAPAAKPPVAGAAGGPGADNVAASIPNGRIFSVLESVKSSNSSAVAANVFLNHPNPTSSTPENDPHFVGTFSLFGLESHAAHGGFNVQVELTQTIGRLQRMNRLTGSQLAVQVIPVKARSTNLEANRKGDNVEMSLGRIDITTM